MGTNLDFTFILEPNCFFLRAWININCSYLWWIVWVNCLSMLVTDFHPCNYICLVTNSPICRTSPARVSREVSTRRQCLRWGKIRPWLSARIWKQRADQCCAPWWWSACQALLNSDRDWWRDLDEKGRNDNHLKQEVIIFTHFLWEANK